MISEAEPKHREIASIEEVGLIEIGFEHKIE
jgi:hypothetical protein